MAILSEAGPDKAEALGRVATPPVEAAKQGRAPAASETEPAGSSWAAFLSCLVWPLICALPLALTLGPEHDSYRAIFPPAWFDEAPTKPELTGYGVADPRSIKPLGLTLGIMAVAVGQVFTVTYHALRCAGLLGATRRIQTQVRKYSFIEGMSTHFAQPEGFALIGGYLVGSWMLGWMPQSYYSFAGGICWWHVAAQLLLQDFLQAIMHLGEHKVSSWVYRNSHKPHHRFVNPRIFDAFDGSLTDTLLMIIVPFVVVARLVPANVWSYMTFGSLYANWLVLIHSEFHHPWDWLFKRVGFGTAGDHHVHHKLFVYNFGHIFAYWDKVFGTYKDPAELEGKYFNKHE
jgi:hypothetical protein